jgi:hypothetical protein
LRRLSRGARSGLTKVQPNCLTFQRGFAMKKLLIQPKVTGTLDGWD